MGLGRIAAVGAIALWVLGLSAILCRGLPESSDRRLATGDRICLPRPGRLVSGNGWRVYSIDDFSIIDVSMEGAPKFIQVPAVKRKHGARKLYLKAYVKGLGSRDEWDVITNGSFTGELDGEEGVPVVPIVLGGVVMKRGLEQTWHRGGLVRLADGTVSLCHPRMDESNAGTKEAMLATLNRSCSSNGSPIQEFMGGGVSLINGTVFVSRYDISVDQQLNNGFDMLGQKTVVRLALGAKDGKVDLLVTKRGSAFDVQKRLCAAGYSDAVLFDGSSGMFLALRKPNGTITMPFDLSKSMIGLKIRTKSPL